MNPTNLPSRTGVAQNADLIALRDRVIGQRPVLGPGQIGAGTPFGSTLGAARGFRAPAYPVRGRSSPWRLSGNVVGAEARISMVPAKVNQAVPKMGATSVAAFPAPYLVVTGATGQIWAKATVDAAFTVTDLEVVNLTATPTETSTSKHNLIGTWAFADGAFTSVITFPTTNITLRFCAGSPIWEPAA